MSSLMFTLDEMSEFLSTLNTSGEVVDFLKKMQSGQATLKDMSDEVVNWIRAEDLENKIGLKFIA